VIIALNIREIPEGQRNRDGRFIMNADRIQRGCEFGRVRRQDEHDPARDSRAIFKKLGDLIKDLLKRYCIPPGNLCDLGTRAIELHTLLRRKQIGNNKICQQKYADIDQHRANLRKPDF
jgi:hypothetical protein